MKLAVLIFLLFLFDRSIAQSNRDSYGFSAFKKYDASFITPDLRAKHSISLGGLTGVYGAETGALFDGDPLTPSVGFHLGYHYLILERRKLKMSRKGKYRDEIKFAFGGQCFIFSNSEFMVMGTIYHQLFGTRGKFFSWAFFSEYGMGIHRTASFLNQIKPLKIDLSLELFRMRFVKQPLYLFGQLNYAVSNDFLSKERINVGLYGGLRYYIYKRKA